MESAFESVRVNQRVNRVATAAMYVYAKMGTVESSIIAIATLNRSLSQSVILAPRPHAAKEEPLSACAWDNL